jgi:disease resistance protein RPM1
MAMAAVGVSVATAALKPLVEKLAAALGKKYSRFKEVRGEIKSLTEELDAMHAFLLKMSEEVENPDVQDKLWMKEVRELSYDMEDSLDEFMIRVDGDSADPHGFMDKCKNIVSKLKTRKKIAKEIEKLKSQVKEVGERNTRYKNPGTIMNISNKSVDPRALTIFEDASKMLVGIHRPKAELIELLQVKKECASSQKTKVVSIVGSGGLGKTTLANQVYQELKEKFECSAFLSVSRTPDMTNILRLILSEVTKQPYANTEAGSTQQLISKIREHLEEKR